jgi:SAM-dependent methyltransferase
MKVEIGGGTRTTEGFVNLDPAHGEGEWRRKVQEGIPVPDGSCDVVRASHVLEHIPAGQERIDVFNEVHRALRPGGEFHIIVPLVGWTDNEGKGHMVDSWHPYADPTHVSFWWFPESLFYFVDGPVYADYGIEKWELVVCEMSAPFEGTARLRKPTNIKPDDGSVVILTSVVGGYDRIAAPLPQSVPTRWVAVTDGEVPDGWERIEAPPGPDARTRAKVAKCRPWDFVDASVVIWLDGAFEVTSPTFVEDMLHQLGDADLAMFASPLHDCIYDEAAYSATLPKYAGMDFGKQTAHYRAQGHPAHGGLWCGGVIVRRKTARVKWAGEAWLDECVRFTMQDQLSLPVVLRRLDIRPLGLSPGLAGSDRWLRWTGRQALDYMEVPDAG